MPITDQLKSNPLVEGITLSTNRTLSGREVREVLENVPHFKPDDITIPDAIRKISNEIKIDSGYKKGWVSGIAISFYDSFIRKGVRAPNRQILNEISNEAAEEFLNAVFK